MTTRAEHLAWCKQRALEYVDAGKLPLAVTSLSSDLTKHPETNNPNLVQLMMTLFIGDQLNTKEQMKEFIEGI
jgi:hypothetical protein